MGVLLLSPSIVLLLACLRPDIGTPTGHVFRSGLGTPYTPAGLRSILRRHGDGATPYQLRHSFAQHVADAGEVPVEVLSRLLGHAGVKTTEIYFRVRDQRVIVAAKNIRTVAG